MSSAAEQTHETSTAPAGAASGPQAGGHAPLSGGDAAPATYLPTSHGDPDAVAIRPDVLHHWAVDEAPDPMRLVDDVAHEAVHGSHDRAETLARLHDAGEAKKQEADAKAQAAEGQLDQQAQDKQTQLKSEPDGGGSGPGPAPAPKPSPMPPPVCTADREQMKREVDSRCDAELRELDTKLSEQKASLDTKLAGQLGSLEAEKLAQIGGLAEHARTGDAKAMGDIQKRMADHTKQISLHDKALDAEVGKQDAPLHEQAEKDAAQAEADAGRDAAETRKHAQDKAKEIITSGKANADTAMKDALRKEKDARASAGARKSELSKTSASKQEEIDAVEAAADRRAAAALAEGEAAAKRIMAKAEADAQQVRAKGESDAAAQLARGKEIAARARDRARAGHGKLGDTKSGAVAEMEAKSNEASARMEAERAKMDYAAGGEIGHASISMQTASADAAKEAEKQKADALEKMKQVFEEAKAKVEAKRRANHARIDSAKPADLCKVQGQVNADLKVMEKTSDDEERQLKGKVQVAEQKLNAEVARQKLKVRGDAIRAKAAIDKLIQTARSAIVLADKGTAEQIAAAAKKGKEALVAQGEQLLGELKTADAGDLDANHKRAELERKAMDDFATQSAAQGQAMSSEVNGRIDKEWAQDAMHEVNKRLQRSVMGMVRPEDANLAMDVLTSLPKEAQALALDNMDSRDLKKMMRNVPESRREEFGALVKNDKVTKADRKLDLWKEYHLSRAQNEEHRHHDDGTSVADKARNDHRAAATAENASEVDDEYETLQKKLAAGTLTTKDVEDLEKRKSRELDIEMKYGINLTNERGNRAFDPTTHASRDGSKIVWSEKDLIELDRTLELIPRDNMGGNPTMKEIRREDEDYRGYGVGGSHDDGVIRLFDNGSMDVSPAGKGAFRFDGQKREYTPSGSGPGRGPDITRMDAILIHELGHNVHDDPKNAEAFKHFKEAAGWKENLDKDAIKDQISAADLATLQAEAAKDFDKRQHYSTTPHIKGKDGKVYMVDPYHKDTFIAVDEDAIPQESKFGYANSNPQDHFAEYYAMATLQPDTLHQKLVEGPKTIYEAEDKKAKDQQKQVDAMIKSGKSATDPQVVAAQQMADAQAKIAAEKKATYEKREKQFTVMRNEVLHTNVTQDDLAAKIKASGGDDKTFEKDAAELSTPEQVQDLAKTYGV